MNLAQLQKEVQEWSTRNFGGKHGTGYRPLLGVAEEVGELCHAHLKTEQGIRNNEDHDAAKRDAVGDIVIYLVDYCAGQDIDMARAVVDTWAKVSQRNWKADPNNATQGASV